MRAFFRGYMKKILSLCMIVYFFGMAAIEKKQVLTRWQKIKKIASKRPVKVLSGIAIFLGAIKGYNSYWWWSVQPNKVRWQDGEAHQLLSTLAQDLEYNDVSNVCAKLNEYSTSYDERAQRKASQNTEIVKNDIIHAQFRYQKPKSEGSAIRNIEVYGSEKSLLITTEDDAGIVVMESFYNDLIKNLGPNSSLYRIDRGWAGDWQLHIKFSDTLFDQLLKRG